MTSHDAIDEHDRRVLFLAEMFPEVDILVIDRVVSDNLHIHFDIAIDTVLADLLQVGAADDNDDTASTTEFVSIVSLMPASSSSSSSPSSVEQVVRRIVASKHASHALHLVSKVLMNAANEPQVEKWRKVSLAKMRTKVGDAFEDTVRLLLMAGYVRMDSSLMVLTEDAYDARKLVSIKRAIEQQQHDAHKEQHHTITDDPMYQTAHKSKRPRVSSSSSSASASASSAKTTTTQHHQRLSRQQVADLTARRLRGAPDDDDGGSGGGGDASSAPTVRAGRIGDMQHNLKLQRQIREIRARKQDKWRTTKYGRQRVFTMADVQAIQAVREQQNAEKKTDFSVTRKEMDGIGRDEMKHTNEFRAQHSLPPVKWHQALCDIAYEHSKNMGDGKAPFSHDGFKERLARYPFAYTGGSENLHHGPMTASAARQAVDGWISSPGHRKNLLGPSHIWCGIGVYRNSAGQLYSTQLFGF